MFSIASLLGLFAALGGPVAVQQLLKKPLAKLGAKIPTPLKPMAHGALQYALALGAGKLSALTGTQVNPFADGMVADSAAVAELALTNTALGTGAYAWWAKRQASK